MTTVRFYNTLSNKQEAFTPLDPEGRRVTFYTCGPTVYDYAHIGNFKSFLNADVLRRTLELAGFEVVHVMNLTDVGHMTEDEVADGAGKDKMEAAANRIRDAKKAGTLPADVDVDPSDPYAIADFYAQAFLDDARMLGLKVAMESAEHPERMPRATRFIEPMIDLVQRLVQHGHAYVASDGAVYFDVQSYPAYGQLSGNTPDRIRSGKGGRVHAATQAVKRHPADFLLWKPDARHLMRWKSPWGEGYPGWHLECSVMATSLLGRETGCTIDIHSGGEDLIFPHHECEIAQARGASGAEAFARYWLHTRFLMVEGEKMSKSGGNFFTVRDLLARGASPAAIRLELIRGHYRANSNFTFQGLRNAQRQIERWKRLEAWLERHRDVAMPTHPGPLAANLTSFEETLANDLNVAGAIGVLNEAASGLDVEHDPRPGEGGAPTWQSELDALRRMDTVLGVLDLEHRARRDAGDLDPALVESRLAERTRAKEAKEWATADRIRDELLAMGIAIRDEPEGTTWERAID